MQGIEALPIAWQSITMIDNQRPSATHRHEALHVAYVMGDIFERHLLNHCAIQGDPVLLAKAEHISELLGDLYQIIGHSTIEGGE